MNIGLVDIDSRNFPNIPLMKLSAYHKSIGDFVEWASPLFGHYDRIYMSKVFSFSADDLTCYDAKEIIRGGSGYAISRVDGREVYDPAKDKPLAPEIEHIYPDYSLYPSLTRDTAYGFLTRGCPRGCSFCIVAGKEGRRSHRVAHVNEFWRGQHNIVLFDPNILAASDWREIILELAYTEANIDFNQGLDARLMTEDKARALARLRISEVHFARDRYSDRDKVLRGLAIFAAYNNKIRDHHGVVYTLVNYDTTLDQDLERIYTLRDLGYWPYVMVYDKPHAASVYTALSRWVNNRYVFAAVKRFQDYKN